MRETAGSEVWQSRVLIVSVIMRALAAAAAPDSGQRSRAPGVWNSVGSGAGGRGAFLD